MMLYPTVQDLTNDKVNRYKLVIEISKKAREIALKAENENEILLVKPVSLAIEAVAKDKGL